MLNQLINKTRIYMQSRNAPATLDKAIADGLPSGLHQASQFLLSGEADNAAASVQKTVEARRSAIASEDKDPVQIYYSPKPGSASAEDGQFDPGAVLNFSRKRIAMTGKDPFWGTFLHLLSRDNKADTILELGACAGLSALYLGSTDSMRSLVTIEAASELADIARETLTPLQDRASVLTGLFNDVLDDILPPKEGYSFVYIDGHHEKEATIHYMDRVQPYLTKGAIVLFDDISWSDDMREGWDILKERKGFTHSVDYGAVGVCIWEGGDVTPKQYDLRSLTGSFNIGSPHGWKYEGGEFVE